MPGADFYLYESIPDAVIVVARDSSIVFSNAHADRLFGYEPGELTSLKIDSLIPEEFRKRHVQVTEQYSAEPAARPMGKGRELVALKSDGRKFPVEVAIGPTENEKATVAVIRDISPIVETRERLSDTETESRDLDRFLRNAPIGLCYFDKELRYLRINNWLADLNGIPVEGHLGRTIADVL
ncbi:MAG: PAS domain S-box protein, partial [bacterium]|nr:PAS domain S-box protein [bacterium]